MLCTSSNLRPPTGMPARPKRLPVSHPLHYKVKGASSMRTRLSIITALALVCSITTVPAFSQTNSQNNPTWWDKYQYMKNNAPLGDGGATTSLNFGSNVDVSNECGPQSETYITLNSATARQLAAGSNEIFRLPMRGYYSSKGGASWGGVDLPLPPAQGANSIDF